MWIVFFVFIYLLFPPCRMWTYGVSFLFVICFISAFLTLKIARKKERKNEASNLSWSSLFEDLFLSSLVTFFFFVNIFDPIPIHLILFRRKKVAFNQHIQIVSFAYCRLIFILNMYRTASFGFLSRRIFTNLTAWASTDASVNLPNPCIAMAPDADHIVCYHPEKAHPYEYTKAIDRTDPALAQVWRWNIEAMLLERENLSS